MSRNDGMEMGEAPSLRTVTVTEVDPPEHTIPGSASIVATSGSWACTTVALVPTSSHANGAARSQPSSTTASANVTEAALGETLNAGPSLVSVAVGCAHDDANTSATMVHPARLTRSECPVRLLDASTIAGAEQRARDRQFWRASRVMPDRRSCPHEIGKHAVPVSPTAHHRHFSRRRVGADRVEDLGAELASPREQPSPEVETFTRPTNGAPCTHDRRDVEQHDRVRPRQPHLERVKRTEVTIENPAASAGEVTLHLPPLIGRRWHEAIRPEDGVELCSRDPGCIAQFAREERLPRCTVAQHDDTLHAISLPLFRAADLALGDGGHRA